MTVDDDMKSKWEAAKDEKEKTAALVATSERTLDVLTHTIDEGMNELVRSADEYAALSLSGCFSGPLEKAIRLLEARCESMEEQGVSRDHLEKIRASLEDMKRRLDVLKTAKRKGMVTKASVAVQGGAKTDLVSRVRLPSHPMGATSPDPTITPYKYGKRLGLRSHYSPLA